MCQVFGGGGGGGQKGCGGFHKTRETPQRRPSSLIICVERPAPHIHVLWGQQSVVSSFAHATPEDENIIAFSQDICKRQIPASVETPDQWLEAREVTASSSLELQSDLLVAPPGPLPPPTTPRPETFRTTKVSIVPVSLVAPLLN